MRACTISIIPFLCSWFWQRGFATLSKSGSLVSQSMFSGFSLTVGMSQKQHHAVSEAGPQGLRVSAFVVFHVPMLWKSLMWLSRGRPLNMPCESPPVTAAVRLPVHSSGRNTVTVVKPPGNSEQSR